MAYKLDYLPLATNDILEAEAGLYEFSSSAADKFYNEILALEERLCDYPLMYPIYKYDDFYRTVNLPYNYVLFYHVEESIKYIEVHRVLHGMRNLKELL